MKKRFTAMIIVGIIVIFNCLPAIASVNSASKGGTMGGYNVSGTIAIDNVNNRATATGSASAPCGMDITAYFNYLDQYGQQRTYSSKNTGYGTSCTAIAEKSGVQALSGTGIFTIVNGPYSWTESVTAPVK